MQKQRRYGKYFVISWKYTEYRFIFYTPHPAFEDETDRGLRNVGKTQSDAREIPKKTDTKIPFYIKVFWTKVTQVAALNIDTLM
jgi:hypothetical protein